jgi:Cu-processing system permease protein
VGALAVARLTLLETRRRRLPWVMGGLGAAYVALLGLGLWFIHREIASSDAGEIATRAAMSMFVVAGLYVVQFLVVVFSAVLAIDSLAAEVGSGTIQTLVTRPISRRAVLMGKVAGQIVVVSVFAAAMVTGALAVGRVVAGVRPPGAGAAVALISLEGVVVLAVGYLAGSRAGALATALAVFGLYGAALAGSWIERIGVFIGNTSAQYLGIAASLLLPTETLWQRAALGLMPPVLRETVGLATPFTAANPPSAAMVAYAVAFAFAALAAAGALFERREL